jgi:hypothetical protein
MGGVQRPYLDHCSSQESPNIAHGGHESVSCGLVE